MHRRSSISRAGIDTQKETRKGGERGGYGRESLAITAARRYQRSMVANLYDKQPTLGIHTWSRIYTRSAQLNPSRDHSRLSRKMYRRGHPVARTDDGPLVLRLPFRVGVPRRAKIRRRSIHRSSLVIFSARSAMSMTASVVFVGENAL